MARAKSGRWLTELEALFVVKEEEQRKDEWRRKLDTMGGGGTKETAHRRR